MNMNIISARSKSGAEAEKAVAMLMFLLTCGTLCGADETTVISLSIGVAALSFGVSAIVLITLGGLLATVFHSRKMIRDEKIFLHLTLKAVGDGLIALDPQGRVLKLNPVAERMTGCMQRQAAGKAIDKVFRVCGPDRAAHLQSDFQQVMDGTNGSGVSGDGVLEASNGGRPVRIHYTLSPINDDNGRKIGALLTFRDMTGEALHQEEIQSELAGWNAAAAIAQLHRFKFNPQTRQLTGLPPDMWPVHEGIAIPAEEWVYPEDLAGWKKCREMLVTGTERRVTLDHRVLHDGRMRYFRVFMRKDNTEEVQISGVVQEITDYVEEHRKQEAAMSLWQTSVDAAPFMMSVKSAKDLRYRQCNGSFAQFIGRPQSEITGRTDAELFDESASVGTILYSDQKTLASGQAVKFHESVISSDGRVHYVMKVKVPARDINGEPVLICMAVDETEEHNRQLELQNLLDCREEVEKLAQVTTYQINYKTNKISGAKNLSEYWPTKDGIAVVAGQVMLPEDAPHCLEEFNAVGSGEKKESKVFFRRQKADGLHYYRLFMHKNETIPDTVSGLMQDITIYIQEQQRREALNAQWNAVADAIPALLFVKDADNDYRYLYANRKLGALLNRPELELIGHRAEEFMCAADAARIRQSDIQVMESGKKGECYELIRDGNGVDHHFNSIKIPSVSESGHRIMIQMTTDVTEVQELSEVRKIVSNAFEKLFFTQNLEEGIRGILKHVCEFVGFTRGYVCCVDRDSNTVQLLTAYYPDSEKPIFDRDVFSIDHVSGLPWYKNILESRHGDVLDCDFTNRADTEKAQYILPLIMVEKDRFDIRGAHVHYLEIDGRPWGYVIFLTQHVKPKKLSPNEQTLLHMAANIIELAVTRKKTVVHLQNAMEEATAAAKTKSNFLATMSHEIRTPLNAVLGFAELLGNPALDNATRQEYLRNITTSGRALLGLINDILELSKLSTGKIRIETAPTSLSGLVTQEGVFFYPKCRARGIDFINAVPHDLPLVRIDSSRMRQILFNLIGNAVKFTYSGSVTVKAEFTPDTQETGTLRVSVTDTGIGISPEKQKNLFSPFAQASAIRGSGPGDCAGLGLSICRAMLECMNGSLSLVSEQNKGSTFTAELRQVQFRSQTGPEASTAPNPDRQPEQLKTFDALSVLIVDDMPMNLLVMQAMLKRLGVDAVTVSNAADALEKTLRRRFDYVLTDLWMPGMNGVELASRIRGQSPEGNVPRIVVVTADIEGKDHFDFSVFDEILIKPVTPLSIQNCFEKA